MPVRDTKKKVFGRCDCCGSKTIKVTGSVFLEGKGETLYLARWTVDQPQHGISFLVVAPTQNEFVSIFFSFEHGSFMVVGPEDQDWQLRDDSMRILEREEVIGTALAEWVFCFIDEIWLNDRHLLRFYRKFEVE